MRLQSPFIIIMIIITVYYVYGPY